MKKLSKKINSNRVLDIVSIGDCVIDAFIHVEEASLHKFNKEREEICFDFGEKLPYESVHMLTAGNCNNAAIGTSRLGAKAGFYGTVGKDSNGELILSRLNEEKVDTRYMQVQSKLPTNFHFVLWYHTDRTILIKHQPFEYKLPRGIENSKWIYLSSIGPKGLQLHPAIAKMLRDKPNMKLAFNPGTFQLRMGLKKLLPLFQRTEILFVNKEEAESLVGRLATIRELAEALHGHGPKTVVITDGLKGSYCLDENVFYKVGIYPHKPVEATGCGDAYASGFTAARIHGLPVSEALRWGARNGAGVATKIGPQDGLVTEKDMIRDLKSHASFRPKVLREFPATHVT
jgi:ribokinase